MAELDIERTEDGTPILTKEWLQEYWDKNGNLTELAYKLGISYPALMLYKKKLGVKSSRKRGINKKIELRKEKKWTLNQ